jgi:hypothetical protein
MYSKSLFKSFSCYFRISLSNGNSQNVCKAPEYFFNYNFYKHVFVIKISENFEKILMVLSYFPKYEFISKVNLEKLS